MPDVKMFMSDSLCHSDSLLLHVPEIVADQMSCLVDGELYELDPDREIDLLLFRDSEDENNVPYDITVSSQTSIIMEVAAYDFDDRMANIGERIKNIAVGVKKLYGSRADEVTVSITFFPVRQDCWTKV